MTDKTDGIEIVTTLWVDGAGPRWSNTSTLTPEQIIGVEADRDALTRGILVRIDVSAERLEELRKLPQFRHSGGWFHRVELRADPALRADAVVAYRKGMDPLEFNASATEWATALCVQSTQEEKNKPNEGGEG